jgi:hypothetical protein
MSVVVCQISRGVAPAICIFDAAQAAATYGAGYSLICGKPAQEAKNEAVEIARKRRSDLILVEDDVLATPAAWREIMLADANAVYVAPTVNRDGSEMLRYDAQGAVMHAGNQLIRLPYHVLLRLLVDGPIFQARDHTVTPDGELANIGPNSNGRGGDTHLFFRLRRMVPRPAINVLPRVQWILHDGNRVHDLRHPSQMEVMG